MAYPRKNTSVFKVLEGLTRHGNMTVDEMIATIGHVTEKAQRYSFVQLMGRMIVQKYVTCNEKQQYVIDEDLKSYIEEMIESTDYVAKENIVAPPYRNLFTSELKNYNLFANKRQYER